MFKRCLTATVIMGLSTLPAFAQTEEEQIKEELAGIEGGADLAAKYDFTGQAISLDALQEAWINEDCQDGQGTNRDYAGCALGQGQKRPGFVSYTWEPGLQMRIFMRPRMLTAVRFDRDVEVLPPVIGDTANFEALEDAALSNLVWVKAKSYNVDGDLKVRDSEGRLYSFILLALPEDNPNLTTTEVEVTHEPDLREQVRLAQAERQTAPETTPASNPAPAAAEKTPLPASTIESMVARRGPESMEKADYLRRLSVNLDNLICDRDAFDVKVPDEASGEQLAPEHICTDGVFTIFDYGNRSDSVKKAALFQVIDEVDMNIPSYKWSGAKSNLLIVEMTGDFSMILGEKYVCFYSLAESTMPEMVDVGGV